MALTEGELRDMKSQPLVCRGLFVCLLTTSGIQAPPTPITALGGRLDLIGRQSWFLSSFRRKNSCFYFALKHSVRFSSIKVFNIILMILYIRNHGCNLRMLKVNHDVNSRQFPASPPPPLQVN
jgi:hypothetical protein